MILYELDKTEKEVLLSGVLERARADLNNGRPLTEMRWKEFIVRVTLKINRGSFGIKYDRQGEFRFCAQSAFDARAIAGYHVKGSRSTIDTTRMVEVVDSVPVGR
jgi:hypothetical protein